jgi:hypothetical protein
VTQDAPGSPPTGEPGPDRRARLWIAGAALLGVAAIAGVTAISLIGRHPLGLGTNGVTLTREVIALDGKRPTCLPQEAIPPGADTVRIYATSVPGYLLRPIHLEISRAGRRLTAGKSAPANHGWVDVPLSRPTRGGRHAVVCVSSPGQPAVWLHGSKVRSGGIRHGALTVDFSMIFLRSASSGGLDWARTVFRRYGLGQLSPFGSWSLAAAGLLALIAGGLSIWLVAREPQGERPPPAGSGLARRIRSVPPAAWLCALVAVLNSTSWSLTVPVFQAGDEPDHLAYVQHIAEAGSPPSGVTAPAYSEEERNLLKGLRNRAVSLSIDERPFLSEADHRRLERLGGRGGSRLGPGGASNASNNPPLYYAVEAIAYRLTAWANLFTRVHVMRVLSALMVGLAVLLIYLFVRELLPRRPWAWSAGALAAAFVPLFGDIGGTIKEDNLAAVSGAGMLLVVAICFRDGLTVRRGLALGLITSVGILSRLSILGLLPGLGVVLTVLTLRVPRANRDEAIRGGLAAIAAVAAPLLLYVVVNHFVWDRGLLAGHPEGHRFGKPPETAAGTDIHPLTGWFSYVWQFYLPSLPGMDMHFPAYQLRYVWFDPFVGVFSYRSHEFPDSVFTAAACVYAVVLALAARELVVRRRAVRARLGELVSYAALLVGLVMVIHWVGYVYRLGQTGDFTSIFEQIRYLFPLLGLYASVIALAARGAGRVAGRAAGLLFVCLALSLSFAAQLLTVWAFYG